MDNMLSFQRLAAIAAILSAPIALACYAPVLAAAGFDLNVFTDFSLMLETGARGAALWRWFMILDMLGYYLLIVPLVVLLWHWLRPRDPGRVDVYSLCLLAYSLIGAMGAAILAAVIPPLIVAYGVDPAQTTSIELVFDTAINMVVAGLWNILEELVAGVGWIGMGLMLRHERRAIGITTVILGVAALIDSIGMTLGIAPMAEAGLYAYVVLAPVWALWLGIDLLRRPVQLLMA